MTDMPLTGSDLRVLADAVDEVEATGLATTSVIGRIELLRPDGDDQVSWIQRFDDGQPDMGWGVCACHVLTGELTAPGRTPVRHESWNPGRGR